MKIGMLVGLCMVIANAFPTTAQGWVLFAWGCILLVFMRDPSDKITSKLFKLISKVNAQQKRIKELKHKLGD